MLTASVPTQRPLTEPERALSDRMVAYWTDFARTGSPNGPDAPPWPVPRSGRIPVR
ncbi:carboxylesterase family protein [Streptomyces sp. NPDC127112]|uniref:carboxylesterase family protein n=1 Tax=Streptomyces sp. NPDC127112 TaxID=3345364 RepID=UPI0036432BFA